MQVWKEYRINGEYVSSSARKKLLENILDQFNRDCTLEHCYGTSLPENSSFTIDGIRNDAEEKQIIVDPNWKVPTGVTLRGTSSKGN
jgi:hypothetical protein